MTVVDSVVLKLDVCVGKMEELNVADDVGDKEMDSVEDEDIDVESDRLADEDGDNVRDSVREAVMAVVGEGESEVVALIDGVEAGVAGRAKLWLWLNVDDPDPDTVAIEDMVMELLGDMETLDDEEGVLLGDVDDETLEEELEEVVADIVLLWDTSAVGERLGLELELGLELGLALEEAVADRVLLWDTAVVGEPLELGLEEVVEDMLVLWDTMVVADKLEVKLVIRDGDGELEITGPAPTATNAIFADCIQFVTVVGSVSPTV